MIRLLRLEAEDFTADSSGQSHVLGHHGGALGVNGAQIGILEEADHVGLDALVDCVDGAVAVAGVGEVLGGDLLDDALEGGAGDQGISGFLVPFDFSESLGTWASPSLLVLVAFLGGLLHSLAGFGWLLQALHVFLCCL